MQHAAVILTHNRKEVLVQAIQGILRQTKPVDHLFLVDNASTDGTFEHLCETLFRPAPDGGAGSVQAGWFTVAEDGITHEVCASYLRLNRNCGSAGGFQAGIRAAYDAGAEWIWIMDDDLMPYSHAYERLCRSMGDARCLLAGRHTFEGERVQWHERFEPRTVTTVTARERLPDGSCYANTCCFEGLVLHRSVVERVGVPDERFFIVSDDTEYGDRIARVYRILSLSDVLYRRLVGTTAAQRSILGTGFRRRERYAAWKTYYGTRNVFLLSSCTGYPITVRLVVRLVWLIFSPFFYLDDKPGTRFLLGLRGIRDGVRRSFGSMPA